jgi:hypothetical protein
MEVDARARHTGERAEQQCDHVALIGRHFLADDQPQHGVDADHLIAWWARASYDLLQ